MKCAHGISLRSWCRKCVAEMVEAGILTKADLKPVTATEARRIVREELERLKGGPQRARK